MSDPLTAEISLFKLKVFAASFQTLQVQVKFLAMKGSYSFFFITKRNEVRESIELINCLSLLQLIDLNCFGAQTI